MDPMTVMSFNIRYANPGDGENTWSERLDRVISVIESEDPDILGIQEALSVQVDDLEKGLPAYAWYGVGRDDGKTSGEYSPVFYRKDRFDLLKGGTFWLSPDPDLAGSVGWDAAITRIATWVCLKDRKSDATFFHFNTHFDHRGVKARQNSVRLLRKKVGEIAGQAPVVITGDFNFEPVDTAYSYLTSLPAGEKTVALRDAAVISPDVKAGKTGTCCGFFSTDDHSKRIDYVFLSEYFDVTRYHVNPAHSGNVFPSDHLPVIVRITNRK